MKLSDMKCKTAKPKLKSYKLFDGEGLYLEVMPNGSKHWRMKFRMLGKEKRIAFGSFPAVSLLEARKCKTVTKQHLLSGFDPVQAKVREQQERLLAQSHTFRFLATEWHQHQVPAWKPSYAEIVKHRFEKYIFPDIGHLAVTDIKPLLMLGCLKKVEVTAPELTRRLKAMCSHVFKYAIVTGRAESDPTYGLEAALKKFRKGHYASISVDEFPDFLLALHNFQHKITRQTFLAIKFLLLTFVRTGELVEAKWDEIDYQTSIWTIPADRMKMKAVHLVPLSKQSVEILRELRALNRNSEYVFPSHLDWRKPMCKNTMLVAIKRMEFKTKMTGHGFRSLALGLIKEKLGYTHDIPDRQLAHVPKSSIDRAYDRAKFLPQRIKMMQEYADCIDSVYLTALQKHLERANSNGNR